MRILMTGAAGFSGRNCAAALARAGHRILGTARRPPSAAIAGVEDWLIGDLAALEALPAGIEAIVHIAALQPYGVTCDQLLNDNVLATRALVAAARRAGVGRFIYFSSTSIYGRIAGPVLSESTPVRDPGDYGLTKYLGERLLVDAAPAIASVALRLPAIVGPGAHHNWLAVTVDRVVRGEPLSIFNPDAAFNNAVHIADLADLVDRLLRRPDLAGFDAVTLGAASTLTIAGTVERLQQAAAKRVAVTIGPAGKPSFTISSERARSVYGYTPMTLEAMLDRIVAERLAAAPVSPA